eukprot:CAMPEP_0172554626 /NCGR_PEP_ID=MMETSP1067-20121228/55516_1 /TAXON_ID=265564 ORGANISM="Thalassiosira punctigera, Strain Tpunct2005C2" /NCGR_SAMPLE_ID=MMETSP1067 /ASSEMBLY_ACC=CAM_ASM_000444 /LENGTH=767 /DNA_ID=CAMNT_0013343031 /DNA_START=294 /DNA_END=2597 /DNA_ORIENTATION=-
MAPEDGGIAANANGGSGAAPHPNWRVVDVHKSEERSACSPFCHPLPDESPAGAAATAAPWSRSACQAALDLHERMRMCTDPFIAPILKSTLHDIEMSYRLYGPFCMVGSYNGGKDAVVIFHLMRAVHAHHCSEMQKADDGFMIPRPRVIYFQHSDEFPEILSLLDETVEKIDVDMLAFKEGVSFGEGLKYLVERNIAPRKEGLSFHRPDSESPLPPPHPLAFILGTRKDDPNAGSQGVYAPSSHYMPPFLRVNPILDWTYGQVWHFLRLFELPYCSLYDDGYTSLGNVKDTLPCPALKKSGEKDEYWPAYMLRDWDLERAGRIDKKKEKDKQGTQRGTGQSKPKGAEGDVSKASEVTMSQTSSTVSLPPDQTESTKVTASMSKVWNAVDEIVAANNKETSPIASAQFSSIGQPTVGLIVIGDELLKGMTPDANILAAAKALRFNNISLSRVSIIPDDGQTIVDEILRFRKEVDVIITSGGVGPTHDDVTIKSVAEALCLGMEMHCEMAELLLEKMGSNDTGEEDSDINTKDRRTSLIRQMSEAQRKMSTLPTSSVLQYLTEDADSEEWPVLQCENLFVLPGVPAYFENNINRLAAYLQGASSHLSQPDSVDKSEKEEDIGLNVDPYETKKQLTRPQRSDTYRILLSLEEETIVSALNASVAAHPHVSFGSYPIVDDPECKTIITLEGRFYNGGYAKSSQRLLRKLMPNRTGAGSSNKAEGNNQIQSLFFSKEEMDRNVASALEDLKTSLPEEGIVCIDSCDDLLLAK